MNLLALVPLAVSMIAHPVEAFDVVWTTPSADAAGSMPIGNGEVVLNAWIEDRTGDLLFYIARTDALSEISRILKLGRIRVSFDPPVLKAPGFEHKLVLRNGIISIKSDEVSLELLVDAGQDVVFLAGESKSPVRVTAKVENWRTQPREIPKEEQQSAWSVHDAPFPLVESADSMLSAGSAVTWYHRNETSIVPKLWENQSLTGLRGLYDPLLKRTFGGQLSGDGFVSSPGQIAMPQPLQKFEVKVATHSAQTESVREWIEAVERIAGRARLRQAKERTARWWNTFWDRTWVYGGPQQIQQAYVLQRYAQAIQGRGRYPMKFNGGYYTVEPKAMGKPFNADWRNWGDCHWFQNVRHMYHPMLASGDFEMMEPFWRLYEAARPLAEARSKLYHGTQGAYFPETMTVFGTYSGGDYGWDRKGREPKEVLCPWWDDAWNQGPELVALMLDRWDYTRDERFLRNRVLPMAESVLRYFDTRFKKNAEGKIILDPTQVVETYWEGVVNDMPTTAGLVAITERLCALPEALLPESRRAFFAKMRNACPELPIEAEDGERELAPAEKYAPKVSNVENGELYAVWPFRVVSLAHPALLQEAKRAYEHRKNKLDKGWGYDGNVAALLGLTDEAARILVVKAANSHPAYRWPATWGPNFDWLPDQNHGGNLLNTTHLMLLQCEPIEAGGAIRLLPAWPTSWNVDFKLHAPGQTTVRCRAVNGWIEELVVTPESRLKDVVLPSGWFKR